MTLVVLYIKTIAATWRDALDERSFRWKLLLIPAVFLLYSAVTQRLGTYIEARKGILLEDSLLYLFPAQDCSLYIFILLYSSILFYLAFHLTKPEAIMRALELQLAVAVVRQVCILLLALEPPGGMILLRDVFLENTVYPHDGPLTKDLFFSGHVASIWICFLCAQRRYFRIYLIFATLLMSFMVLCMRVHYTYDVYGALVITSIIYSAPGKLRYYYGKVKEQLL